MVSTTVDAHEARLAERAEQLQPEEEIGHWGTLVPGDTSLRRHTRLLTEAQEAIEMIADDLETVDYARSEAGLAFDLTPEQAMRLLTFASDVEFTCQQVLEHAAVIRRYTTFVYTESRRAS